MHLGFDLDAGPSGNLSLSSVGMGQFEIDTTLFVATKAGANHWTGLNSLEPKAEQMLNVPADVIRPEGNFIQVLPTVELELTSAPIIEHGTNGQFMFVRNASPFGLKLKANPGSNITRDVTITGKDVALFLFFGTWVPVATAGMDAAPISYAQILGTNFAAPPHGTINYSLQPNVASGATAIAREMVVPRGGMARNLKVRTTSQQSATGAQTIVLRRNGSATALNVVIPASTPAGTIFDCAGAVAISDNDIIVFQSINGAGTGAGSNITFEYLSAQP